MADDKLNKLKAEYKYTGEGEILNDISASEPLKKVTKKVTPKKTTTKKIAVKKTTTKKSTVKKTTTKTATKKTVTKKSTNKKVIENKQPSNVLNNKALYNKLREEGYFILKYRGTLIYDSENSNMIVDFQETGFSVGNKMFSYDGLNFKFKNKK